MDKDKLVVEYYNLCLRFIDFAGPDPVDENERDRVVIRIKEIRELLGMKPINLK